ncbi:hypothetical protein EJ08DRAFT_206855 [Tothia fuscella]|uniref:Uncharacterized protein n=1 Tax=Tothia fuscella TaxID=1048955 RepID=A0A9P4NTL2_9PEZI|nr:hypothetical protein EJ08DRAFT_206855 [Tothia fuscella]
MPETEVPIISTKKALIDALKWIEKVAKLDTPSDASRPDTPNNASASNQSANNVLQPLVSGLNTSAASPASVFHPDFRIYFDCGDLITKWRRWEIPILALCVVDKNGVAGTCLIDISALQDAAFVTTSADMDNVDSVRVATGEQRNNPMSLEFILGCVDNVEGANTAQSKRRMSLKFILQSDDTNTLQDAVYTTTSANHDKNDKIHEMTAARSNDPMSLGFVLGSVDNVQGAITKQSKRQISPKSILENANINTSQKTASTTASTNHDNTDKVLEKSTAQTTRPMSLKFLLESVDVVKVCYIVSVQCYALFRHYDVTVQNVIDLQLSCMDFLSWDEDDCPTLQLTAKMLAPLKTTDITTAKTSVMTSTAALVAPFKPKIVKSCTERIQALYALSRALESTGVTTPSSDWASAEVRVRLELCQTLNFGKTIPPAKYSPNWQVHQKNTRGGRSSLRVLMEEKEEHQRARRARRAFYKKKYDRKRRSKE